ncbi:MAG: MASE1 domain-containing protein [Alphaproteobacteria bacterium]|nr:MASE1 domain-containing protein [Alphaproteobacteria bacterium]MDE2336732.1 MASE1 domain-containing protein [Alphaproteobacteria bacterium]
MGSILKYDGRYVSRVLALVALYYFTSRLGFSLASVAQQVTVIWPPTGISLAAVLMFGPDIWLGIFLGAFLANITMHEPALAALCIGAGNTLEALAGAWLLRRFAGPAPNLAHVRDVLCLILFAAIISTAVSATIGTTSLCFAGLQPWTHYFPVWFTWWLGDAGGDVIVAPLILTWYYNPYLSLSRRGALEAAALALAVALYGIVISSQSEMFGIAQFYPSTVFPLLIWAAIRFGTRGVTTVNFLLSAIAIGLTAMHMGPFSQMPTGRVLDVLQTFTIIAGVTGLVMSAALRERAESEETEQESRIRLDVVLDNIVDGLITIDEKGTIRSYNKACTTIFGYTAAEVVGRNVKMLMPQDYAAHHDEYVSNYMKTGKAKIIGIGRELEGLRKDGTLFPMELSVAEVKMGRGVRYFSGIIRDISERKNAEKRLQAAHDYQQEIIGDLRQKEVELLRYTQDLKRSNQELDDFAYIASHDLKEPLRGLLTQASFLLEDYKDRLDAEGLRRLHRLQYLSLRMEKLIGDLLYFSRLGRTDLAVQELDVGEAVSEIRQMMDTLLKEKNARVVVPRSLPPVVCDKLRMVEVLRNLITNAIKYNDKPERVVEIGFLEKARAPHGDETNVFYVRDNGIGIAPEFHEAIFRIFKRLENPAASGEEGTGSGLTFVKKIIERHNGRIWLESAPGAGATFYFTIGTIDI